MDTVAICAPRIGQAAAIHGLRALGDWRRANAAIMRDRLATLRDAFRRNDIGYELVSSGAYFAYVRHPFDGRPAAAVARRLADQQNILCLPGSMNPNARIPTIEDDGVVVWESNAIIRYLAARYDEGGLWSPDPGERAPADAWMDWMQTTLAPDFYGVFWAVVRTPAARQDRAAIKDLTARLTDHYVLLDRQLAARPYLVGDRFSLADIAVGVTLYRYFEMEIERPALSNLQAWHERLRERPAFRDHVMISFEELRG